MTDVASGLDGETLNIVESGLELFGDDGFDAFAAIGGDGGPGGQGGSGQDAPGADGGDGGNAGAATVSLVGATFGHTFNPGFDLYRLAIDAFGGHGGNGGEGGDGTVGGNGGRGGDGAFAQALINALDFDLGADGTSSEFSFEAAAYGGNGGSGGSGGIFSPTSGIRGDHGSAGGASAIIHNSSVTGSSDDEVLIFIAEAWGGDVSDKIENEAMGVPGDGQAEISGLNVEANGGNDSVLLGLEAHAGQGVDLRNTYDNADDLVLWGKPPFMPGTTASTSAPAATS